jgi:hypothetical protein
MTYNSLNNSLNTKTEYESVFMNIDVKKNMCQGVHIDRNNTALKCIDKGKYLINKYIILCERHKYQKISDC